MKHRIFYKAIPVNLSFEDRQALIDAGEECLTYRNRDGEITDRDNHDIAYRNLEKIEDEIRNRVGIEVARFPFPPPKWGEL